MPNGPGDYTFLEDRLPVPEAEAETLVSRVTSMIDELDGVITRRDSQRSGHLEQWTGPERTTWDEDFVYSQLDLQAAIDNLQTFKGAIEAVLDDIRDHNRSIVPTTSTGTTTTSTTMPRTR